MHMDVDPATPESTVSRRSATPCIESTVNSPKETVTSEIAASQPESRISEVKPQSSTSSNEEVVKSKIMSIVHEERKLGAMRTQLQSHMAAMKLKQEGFGKTESEILGEHSNAKQKVSDFSAVINQLNEQLADAKADLNIALKAEKDISKKLQGHEKDKLAKRDGIASTEAKLGELEKEMEAKGADKVKLESFMTMLRDTVIADTLGISFGK